MIDVESILRNELFLDLDASASDYDIIFKEYAAKCERTLNVLDSLKSEEELTFEQEIECQNLIKAMLPSIIAIGDILVIHPIEQYFDAFFEHLAANVNGSAFFPLMKDNVANFSIVSDKMDAYFEKQKNVQ